MHVRLLGGDLLKAMVANDGGRRSPSRRATPVSLRLPADALRVLRDGPVVPPEEEPEAAAAGAGNGHAPVSAD